MKYTMLCFLMISNVHADLGATLAGKSNLEVKKAIHKELFLTHRPLSYKQANIALFTKIDNYNGTVCSVYSPSFCMQTDTVPSHKIMNIEHTWPQSQGAHGEAKADLHHLFATTSSSNSIRSSLPFCVVNSVLWQADQSKRGMSVYGDHCFEPPDKHKGNVARALFYFAVRYNFPIDSNQEQFLRQWHKDDPVDTLELERNKLINSFQGNTNLFIDEPLLVDLLTDF